MPTELLNLFAKIEKTDQRIVVGIASTDTLDNQAVKLDDGTVIAGDIVDPAAIEGALADYMAWANIREMHQPSAVGTAVKAEVVGGKLQLTARVVDDTAWEKVKAGVYKGFSIGGRVVEAVLEKLPDGRTVRRVLKLVLSEISLVDRPANPDARILLWKAADGRPQEAQMTVDELWTLMKAAVDPAKIVSLIQAARNQCELDGDLPGAELYTQAIALVMQAAGEAEPEDEPEAEPGTEGGGMDDEDQVASALTAGAKTADLKKAGRKISGGNIAAMHKVLKALIDMLATAGDEVAQKLQLAYGMDKAAVAGGGDGAAALAKVAGETAVKPVLTQLDKLAEILAKMDGRLTTIEQQPVPGGPILRPVEKVIAGQPTQPTDRPDYETVYKAAYLDELKRLAATEPNPSLRADYQRQLAELSASVNGQAK